MLTGGSSAARDAEGLKLLLMLLCVLARRLGGIRAMSSYALCTQHGHNVQTAYRRSFFVVLYSPSDRG